MLAIALAVTAGSGLAAPEEQVRVEPDSTVHVPPFDLPESAYLSDESRAAMKYFESAFLVSAINGFARPVERTRPPRASGYFQGVAAGDPVVAPGDHEDLLARFPPTLLISGTRDFAMGGVLASHATRRLALVFCAVAIPVVAGVS